MNAAYHGRDAILRVLIAAWAGLEAEDSTADQMNSLQLAAVNGHASACRILIEESASISAKDKNGKTALDWAKKDNRVQAIAVLEEAEALAVAFEASPEGIAAAALINGTAPKGCRFATPKTDVEAPVHIAKALFNAHATDDLRYLARLCVEWAGNLAVIDGYSNMVSLFRDPYSLS